MKRIACIFAFVMALGVLSQPASAQTIGGICQANSFNCGHWIVSGGWLSLYGTNLPVTNPGCSGATCGGKTWVVGDGTVINNNLGSNYLYWYESTTQINFLPYGGTAPTVVVQVCNANTQSCTPTVTINYN